MRNKRRISTFSSVASLIVLTVTIILVIRGLDKRNNTSSEVPEFNLFQHGLAMDTWLYKTYDIAPDPYEPGFVWFATAQGLRLHQIVEQTWNVYGAQDGLPNGEISSVAPDDAGLWIGTWQGLYRWNRNTRNFFQAGGDSAYTVRIMKLWRDEDYLAAATYGDGLIFYDLEGRVLSSVTTKNGIASNKIYSLTRVAGLWYLGHENGRISVGDTLNGWKILEFKDAKTAHGKNEIWDLLAWGSKVWAATSAAGIWEYDFALNRWKQHAAEQGLYAKGAYSLARDTGTLYAGTPSGLFRYDLAIEHWLQVPENPDEPNRQVTALALDITSAKNEKATALWYAALGRGIGKCGTEKVAWYEYAGGIQNESVTALAAIGDWIWAGYGYQGGWLSLIRSDFTHVRHYTPWVGMPLEKVQLARRFDETVFIGSFNGFAYYEASENPKWRVYTKLSKQDQHLSDTVSKPILDVVSVLPISQKSGDGFLIGTGSGMLWHQRSSGVTDTARDFPRHQYYSTLLKVDSSLFVGTLGHGITVYSQTQDGWKAETTYFANTDLISSSVQIDSTQCWFGTRNQGLIQVFLSKGKIDKKRAPIQMTETFSGNSLKNISILSMEREGDQIWMGTRAQGLLVYNLKDSFWLALKNKESLSLTTIYTVTGASKYIWLGTGKGLIRMQRDSLSSLLAKVEL